MKSLIMLFLILSIPFCSLFFYDDSCNNYCTDLYFGEYNNFLNYGCFNYNYCLDLCR